ncbi:WAT1-related protein [Carex littledalei]|uniref:WAT1-related protein n=1 Tax=Carex littledalei TaxID=544730 RepID=A0A833RL18_9POAL|nr:WAT1-related protein [Carex littledalei]
MGGAQQENGTGGGSMEGLKPVLGMILVQTVFAGMNIIYKLAIDDGMDLRILTAYRHAFATVFLVPVAFILERNSWREITWKVVMFSFLCGLFGGTLAQNLYVVSLKLTSATFAAAMTNLVPAMTFILAALFRLETFTVRTLSGQAKVFGTILGVGGAMVLTFYKGIPLEIWETHVNLVEHNRTVQKQQNEGNQALGSLLAVCCCLCYAIFLTIQAKLSKSFPYHTSSTAMLCFMAMIQSFVFALIMQRDWTQWRFGWDIRLLCVSYSGILSSGMMFTVMAWCIRKKGPLFASVFNPLMLVIVAILSSLLLNEKLHLGSVIGTFLIVLGLYMVLWGKGREPAKVGEMPSDEHEGDEQINVVIDSNSARNSVSAIIDSPRGTNLNLRVIPPII